MRRLHRHFALTGCILAGFASPLFGQGDWELLGTRKVALTKESDVIEVGRREGRFSAIRIEVDDKPMEMHDIRVVFVNNQSYSPDTRIRFAEGSWSRTIDLPGDSRTIERIVFRYRASMRMGASTVRVYGRRVDERGDRREERVEERHIREGWTHLGSREVDFRSDHDVIKLPGDRRYNTILLAVEGADIELYNLSVTFGNGDRYKPDLRLVFEANSRSRFIDLPGATRDIRNVEFGYRTLRRQGAGKAIVHLFGRTRTR